MRVLRFFRRFLRAVLLIALSPVLLLIFPFLLAYQGARFLGGADPDCRGAERLFQFRIF